MPEINKSNISELTEAIKQKYAWPGGYPLYLLMCDGECLCMKCANKEKRLILAATKAQDKHDSWCCAGFDVNWEDIDMICANCNQPIESAYGE